MQASNHTWFRARLPGVILLSLLALGATSELPGSSGSLGWHGEVPPDGLVRGARRNEYLWKKDDSVMVYVPPGTFLMGRADGPPSDGPQREVYLDGYYVDKYEVSWRQWKRSGLPYADHQFARRPYPEAPDWGIEDAHPVMSVSWEYAQQYLQWAGKRLPTEAEWEKAARGTDGRKYPWGDEEPTFEHAFWREHPVAKKRVGAIDSSPLGVSPYGVFNMAGNVYEWCFDVFASDFYAAGPTHNPRNDGPGRFRVLRGGAFLLEKEDLASALRYRLRATDRAPYIGFRGALSARGSRE